jgi:F-type H+-transporting ATPase subunit alpha
MEKEITILYAGTRGILDDLPLDVLASFEKQLYEYIGSKHPDIFGTIKEAKEINADLDAKMKAALEAFKAEFKASLAA